MEGTVWTPFHPSRNMPKKPWRTVKIFGPTGRFTREQLRDAVRHVSEKRVREAQPEADAVEAERPIAKTEIGENPTTSR